MTHIVLAANNGEIGGGEVMLLAIAEVLREMGVDVLVVGPENPQGVIVAAQERGFPVEALPCRGRPEYMLALRRWRKAHPEGVLWCNGLVPATATAGMAHRIVHLHQLPAGPQQLVVPMARARAMATLVPSQFMASKVRGARVLANWSPALERVLVPRGKGPVRLGFLGRPSEAKGIPLLADAMGRLRHRAPLRYFLRIAGEPRFVDARERVVVEGRIRSLGRSVQELGWMVTDEFLGTIDILVVPSVWDEPFGLVVTEAMSARVPVVVTDAGALPEVVGHDHPWIAHAGDPQSLADVIAEAATALPADDVVERAHKRWAELFSPEVGREALGSLLAALDLVPGERRIEQAESAP
ncbi:glycosyltransferase family 4 protein [Sinomonas humi]|uniref:glycosyltransferase family 4 protein n=1 Tax=Sinomonas humi TaxID=1338436 RepID=UPI0006912258|nr:glycosyltransferase family 4 protein [Sinomonas humi]